MYALVIHGSLLSRDRRPIFLDSGKTQIALFLPC